MAGARDGGGLVESGAVGGRLDNVAEPKAAIDAAGAVFFLALAEAVIVDQIKDRIEALGRRNVVENVAGLHSVRQVGIAQHVDAAHLDRVELELAGNGFDRAFHHPRGDRHRRTHRAGATLVGQRDLYVVTVIGNAIRSGQDQRDHAGHVIGRVEAIGAEVDFHVERQRENAAFGSDCALGRAGFLTRMACGEQVLHAVFLPANRALQMTRQRGNDQFFTQKRDLLAKGTANVRADDANLRLVKLQATRKLRAQRMRGLIASAESQALNALVPLGNATARFHWRMRDAVLREARFDNEVGRRDDRVRLATREDLTRNEIAGNGVVEIRRAVCDRCFVAGDSVDSVVVDLNQCGSVFCEVSVGGNDNSDGIADEEHLVDRQCWRFDRQNAFDVGSHAKGRRPLRQISAGENADDAFSSKRCAGVYRTDISVRVRRAHEADMQRAMHLDVVEITPLPRQKTAVFAAKVRTANVFGATHARSPLSSGAADRTASTMFW